MKVFVLDGDQNQAVACTRSLAHSGHTVWVGAPASWSKSAWSAFCSKSFIYSAPEQGTEAFLRDIIGQLNFAPGSLVLPLTERTTLPISSNRDEILRAGGVLVLPPHDEIRLAFDKLRTTSLARSLGIAVPQTVLVESDSQAEKTARNFHFPAVLKPRSSERLLPDGCVRPTGAPLYAGDAEEFLRAWVEISQRANGVLVQQFVQGSGEGYFALMHHGELRAEFAHRRIRDVRPTGSGSAVRVSIHPRSELREPGLAILKALHWHGVAMVEFRVRPDGTAVFMEVNGRFWNSLALAVHAGVDFPALLAHMAENGDVEPPPPYREGIRCRWLLGDVRHLLSVWRGAPSGYPDKYPGRLRSTLDFFTPVPGTFHDNFEWADPLPEIGDWLDFLFRRIPSKVQRRPGESEEPDAERGPSRPQQIF